jgi:DNA-binding CsgD family transcriptional regulator
VGRFLTKHERKLLEKELRVERYARFSDRIKCILLLDTGKSPESIAEYLFLSRNTVANYLKRYQAGGLGKSGKTSLTRCFVRNGAFAPFR